MLLGYPAVCTVDGSSPGRASGHGARSGHPSRGRAPPGSPSQLHELSAREVAHVVAPHLAMARRQGQPGASRCSGSPAVLSAGLNRRTGAASLSFPPDYVRHVTLFENGSGSTVGSMTCLGVAKSRRAGLAHLDDRQPAAAELAPAGSWARIKLAARETRNRQHRMMT